MTTKYRCPECGGRLFIDADAETEMYIVRKGFQVRDRPLEVIRQRVPVAFCATCEFSLEINPR